jgi:hypothetical protein
VQLRTAREIDALDVEPVLFEDAALDPNRRRREDIRGGLGRTSANLIVGAGARGAKEENGGRGKEREIEQECASNTIEHGFLPTWRFNRRPQMPDLLRV